MEFSISTDSLKKEVGLLHSVAEKKTGVAALSSVLIETKDKQIQLTATDLDTTIQILLDADIKTEGHFCVPAKKLADIIKSLDSGEIKFKKQATEHVQVQCNKSKFRLAGMAKEHFPVVPAVDNDEVTIDGDTFKSLISHTCFATTNEESRFSLGGVKLEIGEGKINAAATDGHRIAMMEYDIDDTKAKMDVLVPKRALNEVVKVVEEQVTLSQDENHIKFESGDRVLISRKLAVNFPDYKKALPQGNDIEISVDGSSLVKGLKRNAIMADERSFSVKIEVKEDELVLSSGAADSAEETVECKTKNLPEEGVTLYMNWMYLVEYLNICDAPVIKLKDGLSAVEVIDGTSTYVCMPLRPSGA